jgi:hypothetical protein
MDIRHEWKNGTDLIAVELDGGVFLVKITHSDGSGSIFGDPLRGPEILRLAARLQEAEELLREVDRQILHPDYFEEIDHCPFCNALGHRGHNPDCRLAAFLSEQTATPPG